VNYYIICSLNKREKFIMLYQYTTVDLFASRSNCLIQYKLIKIKSVVNLPYKKFRTNFPRFNQNHSYLNFKHELLMQIVLKVIKIFAYLFCFI
jgi:hypothetical protein